MIKEYEKNGQSYFAISVDKRCKEVPGLKVQRRIKGIKTRPEAVRKEKELRDECVRELCRRSQLGKHWGGIVESWIHQQQEIGRISKLTIVDYQSMLERWTKDIWEIPAKDLARKDIAKLIDKAKHEGKSNSFLNKLQGSIGQIYKWGKDEGLIKSQIENVISGLSYFKRNEKVPEILNRHDLKRFLSEAREREHKYFYVWAFASVTGMRNGELMALEWSDVNLDERTISVNKSYNKRLNETKCTKAGYFRTVPISPELETLLMELKNTNLDSKYVLPRFSSWINANQAIETRSFCKEIGVTSVRFHSLRACFATHLLSNGTPSTVVQKICGWENLKTMERYIRFSGVNEKGATDNLNILPFSEKRDNLIPLNPVRKEEMTASGGH